jgi:hypothetical protein
MKLRMQANSVRFRLKQSEVERLVNTGLLEETISFGKGNTFTYILEATGAVTAVQAAFKDSVVTVQIPYEVASRWAGSNEVGIEALQPAGSAGDLQVLIEKDFACLDKSAEENFDTFPNPLAGSKC